MLPRNTFKQTIFNTDRQHKGIALPKLRNLLNCGHILTYFCILVEKIVERVIKYGACLIFICENQYYINCSSSNSKWNLGLIIYSISVKKKSIGILRLKVNLHPLSPTHPRKSPPHSYTPHLPMPSTHSLPTRKHTLPHPPWPYPTRLP